MVDTTRLQSLSLTPAVPEAPVHRDAVMRAAATAELRLMRRDGFISSKVSADKEELLSTRVAQVHVLQGRCWVCNTVPVLSRSSVR